MSAPNGFTLTDIEKARFERWYREHLIKCHGGTEGRSIGAIGMSLEAFEFQNTSVGTIVTVRCTRAKCRHIEPADITDYQSW